MEQIVILLVVLAVCLWLLLRYLERKFSDVVAKWRKLLDRTDVLIVDTETTGFGRNAEVIEVAVLDTTGFVRYEALSLPQGEISKASSNVHGLTRAKLKAEGAQPWPAVHRELVSILRNSKFLLAWNSNFDERMLQQTANRHGLTLPRVTWYDLIDDYRNHYDESIGKGQHTLDRVVKREGVRMNEPAHRAIGDCKRVLAVMRAVIA